MPWAPGRPALGGLIVIGLVWLVGTRDYLGLGVPVIQQSFEPNGVSDWAFLWKLVFTAVTLGSGFKGGEVTPLFFIGATLGCALGHLLGVPPSFLAALGFVAVFAGAANTPLACTVMGIELFGPQYAVFLAVACCGSYVWSGHRGIYLSQVLDTPKTDDSQAAVEATLAHVRRTQEPLVLNLYPLARLGRRLLGRPAKPSFPFGDPAMKHDARIKSREAGPGPRLHAAPGSPARRDVAATDLRPSALPGANRSGPRHGPDERHRAGGVLRLHRPRRSHHDLPPGNRLPRT